MHNRRPAPQPWGGAFWGTYSLNFVVCAIYLGFLLVSSSRCAILSVSPQRRINYIADINHANSLQVYIASENVKNVPGCLPVQLLRLQLHALYVTDESNSRSVKFILNRNQPRK